MKRKDILAQIRNKPEADLQKELEQSRERLWSLKKDLAAGKVKNVREIREVKKTIARIMTLLVKSKKNP